MINKESLIQLSQSQNELNKANEKIKNLNNEINNRNKISNLKEENENLKTILQINKSDIINYKNQINELIQKKKENENEISKLKREKIDKKEENKNINFFNSIQDLQKNLNLELLKKNNDIYSENTEISKNINKNVDNKIKNLEELQNKKTNYELKFIELKKKSNEFYLYIKQQEAIVNNYKKYIREINQQMNIFHEQLNISVSNNNGNIINNNTNKKDLDEIYSQIDVVSVCMVELDEIIFNIKNIFGQNIEYLLNQRYNNLIKIDRREYKDENTLKSLIEKIGHAIEEIQNIFFIFTEKNDNFYNINHNVEEEINKLKYIYTKYKKEYKKIRIKIIKIIKTHSNYK